MATQPLFSCRRDRQRIALRRGYGLVPAEIARLERATAPEIGAVLAQGGMAELVAAHRRFAALSHEAQLAELQTVAMRILRLRLLAQDVRACIFFAREMRAGRDPSRTLAEAVIAAAERHALRVGPRAPDATDLRLDPVAPAEPPPPAPLTAAEPDPTDRAAARAEAAHEAGRFEAKIAATRAKLAREIAAERMREASAPVPAQGLAIAAQRRAARRARAAARRQALAERQAAAGRSLPPPWTPAGAEARALARFAERSAIEARLALLRMDGTSLAGRAARRLPWATAAP